MQKKGELRLQAESKSEAKKADLAQGEAPLTLSDVGVEYWEAKRWKELAGIETEGFGAMQKKGELREQDDGASPNRFDKQRGIAERDALLTLADVGVELWEARRWKELAGIETEECDQ